MNLRLVFSNLGLKASEKKNDEKKTSPKVQMPEMKYHNMTMGKFESVFWAAKCQSEMLFYTFLKSSKWFQTKGEAIENTIDAHGLKM